MWQALAAAAMSSIAKAATPAPATSGASGGLQSSGMGNTGWTVNIGEGSGSGLDVMELALFAGVGLGLWLILRKKS